VTTRRIRRDPSTSEIWVVQYRAAWALQLEHEEKPFTVIGEKEKAIDAARSLAQKRATDLVVFDASNNIERRESHRTTLSMKRPRRTPGRRSE